MSQSNPISISSSCSSDKLSSSASNYDPYDAFVAELDPIASCGLKAELVVHISLPHEPDSLNTTEELSECAHLQAETNVVGTSNCELSSLCSDYDPYDAFIMELDPIASCGLETELSLSDTTESLSESSHLQAKTNVDTLSNCTSEKLSNHPKRKREIKDADTNDRWFSKYRCIEDWEGDIGSPSASDNFSFSSVLSTAADHINYSIDSQMDRIRFQRFHCRAILPRFPTILPNDFAPPTYSGSGHAFQLDFLQLAEALWPFLQSVYPTHSNWNQANNVRRHLLEVLDSCGLYNPLYND